LSYVVPSEWLEKASIKNLRISASVRNVAFWAPKWKYGDPEGFPVPSDNDSKKYYPTPRTYNLSLNFSL
ncbi:MAG: hypothetical protein ACRDE7_11090, partial [Sphingobacterium sp.]